MRFRVMFAAAALLLSASSAPAQPAPQSSGPAPATQPALRVPYTHFTLPNGLDVILHEDRSVPVVSINMWYHVGSGSEKPGRTGFAHLFEHLMFEGSKHVPEGAFDTWLEAAGANNNGSTTRDRTNYYIDMPSNALDLGLFLESDRMGYLLDIVTPALVDGQRDVVKNERRSGVENRPYGMADVKLDELLYPKSHPYSWPVIGHMEDLTAATDEDVREFFRKYYAPGNASLSIAGDIDIAETRKKIEHWFSDVKPGAAVEPNEYPAAVLTAVTTERMTDKVQLPRLTLAWLTPPLFAPGDAEMDLVASVLAGGKNSRLFKRLVYDMQVAQSVSAYQASGSLGSEFYIVVMARPQEGKTADEVIADITRIVDEELETLRQTAPEARELARAINKSEASFFARMERVGGFGGKADQLNGYFVATGNPDYFNEDLARYRAIGPDDIRAAVRKYLPADTRVELIVVPEGGAQ
ncbi:MAG TPA: pitrilysin family protein [Vicinamibacterales bacterium]|nr:pitrilysin family protein [Vicinamibacterales bacterium]